MTAEEHWSQIALDRAADIKALEGDLAHLEDKYATLLKRWENACTDLAIFRQENKRLNELLGG